MDDGNDNDDDGEDNDDDEWDNDDVEDSKKGGKREEGTRQEDRG